MFVDGENLVLRYQEMLGSGRVPRTITVSYGPLGGTEKRPLVKHLPNCFVWSSLTFADGGADLLRINYFTSVVGDDQRVSEMAAEIARTPFWWDAQSGGRSHLQMIPRVHKKSAQSKKTKVVDIDLTMDVLRAAMTMPIDIIILISGDGDYVPLIREVARSTSKQVYVAAFSSGLADGLRSCAENFTLLDHDFFEPDFSDIVVKKSEPPPSVEPTPET